MADSKLSALTELAATPASDDELYLRDVSEAPADESKRITIANLLAGAPTAHAASHVDATDDIQSATAAHKGVATAAQITKLDGITALADVTGSNAPQAHAASHQNAGGDEVSVVGLSGLLADDQHVLDAEVVIAAKTVKLDDLTATDDNTDLNASTTKHGLMPKGTGTANNYFKSDNSQGTLHAASTTVVGAVELAIASELDTGTDATRAVTPDSLAGASIGKRVVQLKIFDDATAVATGDGKLHFFIPPN